MHARQRHLPTGFGDVWRQPTDEFTARHAADLRELLLFELAHEGAATEAMRAAAAAGGIADEFAGWEAGLRTASASGSS